MSERQKVPAGSVHKLIDISNKDALLGKLIHQAQHVISASPLSPSRLDVLRCRSDATENDAKLSQILTPRDWCAERLAC